MKKIVSLIGAGAMLLSLATPALAVWPMWGSDNVAMVENGATAYANTGGNSQDSTAKAKLTVGSSANAGSTGDRTIVTGDADAYAGALVVANTHVGVCGGCAPSHDDDVAGVKNGALADANTGVNAQDDTAKVKLSLGSSANSGSTGNRTVVTGSASSTGRAWTVVNTHVGF